LILGLELESIPGKAGAARAFEVFIKCFERGVLVRQTADIIALSPPLIIEQSADRPDLRHADRGTARAIAAPGPCPPRHGRGRGRPGRLQLLSVRFGCGRGACATAASTPAGAITMALAPPAFPSPTDLNSALREAATVMVSTTKDLPRLTELRHTRVPSHAGQAQGSSQSWICDGLQGEGVLCLIAARALRAFSRVLRTPRRSWSSPPRLPTWPTKPAGTTERVPGARSCGARRWRSRW